MWQNKTISVIISTYREKNSVRKVADDFFNTGCVDEVIVVNNNAEPGTDDEIRKTRSRLIHEPKQGYGYGYRRGIKEATSDYVVLCEADNTYAAEDLERFLVFAKDFPIVVGSRTNRSTIFDTKTMNLLRRLSNVIYAKVIEIIYSTTTLTDVGCTYKLFHKEALRKLEPQFQTTNSLFATELVLLAAVNRIPFVEIPVTFRERIGISGTIPHFGKLIEWAIRIWIFIWTYWWKWQWKKLFLRNSNF
ncbi:MAG: glycosyltransferase family 2 protein [Candidatus Yanofskybacteria bacterium]|nr:glycosyltransferase family 2 protein [Candidatus Yanofskybacteria bacterium]